MGEARNRYPYAKRTLILADCGGRASYLIGSTTTRTGLKVKATLDKKSYEKGQRLLKR